MRPWQTLLMFETIGLRDWFALQTWQINTIIWKRARSRIGLIVLLLLPVLRPLTK